MIPLVTQDANPTDTLNPRFKGVSFTNVTGYWKTDQNVILGLLYLLATLILHLCTVALPGLADLSSKILFLHFS